MNGEQATALLTRLRAAYPAATLNDDTIRLYLAELRRMDFETGNNAVQAAISSCRFLPSIAELHDHHNAERERRRRLNDEQQRRLERDAYDRMPRVPLKEIPAVSNWANREGTVPLEAEGIGDCSDCLKKGVTVYRVGKFRVCASCGGRRIRAGAKVA